MFSLFKAKAPKEPAAVADLGAKLAQARALGEQGRLAEAAGICGEILKVRGDDADALLLAGEIAARQGDVERAIPFYVKLTELRPEWGFAHFMLGNLLIGSGRLEAALDSYERAAALDAGQAEIFCNRGVVLERLERFDAALASYAQALSLDPGNALTHYNRAAVLSRVGRKPEALASYEQAIACKPDYAEAYFNRGNVLKDLERRDAALASYERAIECNPRFAEAHGYRGALLYDAEQWDAALASYDRAIELDPGYAEAYYNRGVLRQAQKQSELAMADYGRAIELVPHYAEAHMNRGALCHAAKRFEEALASFDEAIALDPDYALAYLNRALVLIEFRILQPALESLDRVIALTPASVEAHHRRGWVLFEMKRFRDAAASFDRVLELEPNCRSILGMRTVAKMTMCDWSDFESDTRRLTAGILGDLALSAPLAVVTYVDRADLQQRAAQIWAREECAVDRPLPAMAARPAGGKIRIGYFSADFREHIVSHVAVELFEQHDRSKFELIAFSLGPETGDDMERRLQRAFDRFINVSRMSDEETALLARSMGVDVAVDLGGYTSGCRTKIFALRAAPIQINFLGYPGTLGAPFMDYLIADRTVIPEALKNYYTEKIIHLPHSFLPQDSTRAIADAGMTRQQFGLPPDGFVFCCFNSCTKITPGVFDGWMRILGRVPGSVLWFSQSNAIAAANLRQAAARRGIAAERLIFADRLPSLADHLARHALGDLFLDTLPYNAHSTAMDALWSGLPLITRIGVGFAGRVAASLLTTIGLPELVTTTPEEYEDLAVELATNRGRLAAIRQKLAENRATSPLFDMRAYTRHLESAYAKAWERHQAQLPPDHIGLR
jgi:predicted O-linked N-acetylglucosamine transferase (SPINDLY family)